MKKQVLGIIISIAILSITPLLASSSSDDNNDRRLTKKKPQASALKKGSSTKQSSSRLKPKKDSKDSGKKSVQPHKSNSKGKKVDNKSPFPFLPQSSIEESPTYSITTTDSPANDTTTPSDEKILAPQPTAVQKSKTERVPQHAAEFKKKTGHKSATDYSKEKNVDMDDPQIGHIQSYKNHGPDADTRKDNLVVIGQTTNLTMNIADRKYQNGDIDANCAITQKDNLIAKHIIQQCANPSNPNVPSTPAVVLPGDMEKPSKEEKEKRKKSINRAMNPERQKAIVAAQVNHPEKFTPLEENNKKIQKKIREYQEEGKPVRPVIKFPDQSHKTRNVGDKIDQDNKDKK